MTDPFDVLFDPGGSTEPDPEFRRQLMTRVRAALADEADVVLALDTTDITDDEDVPFEFVSPAPEQPRRERRHLPLMLAAALVAVIGGLVVIRVVSNDSTTPSAPLASLPEPPVTEPTPVTSAQARPCPNPEGRYSNHCLGPLDPGKHRTTTFEPSFSYSVPDGWWNIEDTGGNYVLLPPGETLASYGTGTADYIGVFASVAAPAGCEEYPDPAVATTVEAYTGWLRAQPALDVSEPLPIVIGGLDGTQLDVALSGAPACPATDGTGDFVPVLLGKHGSLLGYEPGQRADRVDATTQYRLILFDRPDGRLMVIELADRGTVGDGGWWTTAGEITDTFEFQPDPNATGTSID